VGRPVCINCIEKCGLHNLKFFLFLFFFLFFINFFQVIEADVQPSDLCTRREYARWLVAASSVLSRYASFLIG